MTVFQHEATKQVIDVDETRSGIYDVLGTPMETSILNTCGWWKCDTDPNYRGMPKASAEVLTRPSADSIQRQEKNQIVKDFKP